MTYSLSSKNTVVGSQAKYGPKADLTPEQQNQVSQHYTPEALDRATQYNAKHSTYVNSAEQTGRPLTQQETVAKKTGKNAPNSSIDHVIASGTGQNILNHETLRFNHGAQLVDDNFKTATTDPSKVSDPGQISNAQKQSRLGIAEQASAVGRAQGYSRAIVNEREGEVQNGQSFDVLQKRKDVMQKTLTAFQGRNSQQQVTAQNGQERFEAYKEVLKETFDSPGNLRVGDRSANTKISTGLDMPLDVNGKATPHGQRLLDAHQNYAPDRLLTDKRTFTKDESGNIMSSSQEKTSAPQPQQENAKPSEKLKALLNTPEAPPPDPLTSVPKQTVQPQGPLTSPPKTQMDSAPKQIVQPQGPLTSPPKTQMDSAPKQTVQPQGPLTSPPKTQMDSAPKQGVQPQGPLKSETQTVPTSRKRPRTEDNVNAPPPKRARTEPQTTAPSRKRARTEDNVSSPPSKRQKTETQSTTPSNKRPRTTGAQDASTPSAKRRKPS